LVGADKKYFNCFGWIQIISVTFITCSADIYFLYLISKGVSNSLPNFLLFCPVFRHNPSVCSPRPSHSFTHSAIHSVIHSYTSCIPLHIFAIQRKVHFALVLLSPLPLAFPLFRFSATAVAVAFLLELCVLGLCQ